MESSKTLVFSAIIFLLIVDCLGYSNKYKRETSSDEDPECQQSTSEDHGSSKPICCKLPDLVAYDIQACISKLPNLNSSSPQSHEDIEDKVGCYFECAFNKSGLLTSDGKLDKPEMKKLLTDGTSSLPQWSNGLKASLETCLDNSVYAGVEKHECKSGTIEFVKCVGRYLFLNCPSTEWTSSDECMKLKLKIEKCPKMPVSCNLIARLAARTTKKPE